MPENGNRFTPFGVISRHLYDEGVVWDNYHADEILRKLTAEGYTVVDTQEKE